MHGSGDAPSAPHVRVGVDIGGTFTDVVMFDDETGELRTAKTWSTPEDPAQLVDVFGEVGLECAEMSAFSHATTVGVNAVVTRTGAPTAMLCTRGHRDILDMGRGLRRIEELWDFSKLRPHLERPLIPRRWRRAITERTLYDGAVLLEVDEEEVLREVRALLEDGVESLAIAYINSYVNPANERRTRDIVRSAFPDLPVFASTDVFPVFREVFRTTSAAINAYVSPKVDAYVSALEQRLVDRRFAGRFTVMKVDGGFATGEAVRGRGIETIHSGPVAGVSAARLLGAAIGRENLMIIDMGGTTADVSMVAGGSVPLVSDFEVEQDLFLGIPVVDVQSIGAGGGSIAWVDEAGGLRVGPASAGSDPGPACYGRGGSRPTVTDAHLVRGTLSADHFLGGTVVPDVGAARRALERVADPLGISVEDAAQGVIDIVEVNMAGALRSISIYRGHDPRDYALLAVGAAGPMHGSALSREIGAPETVIPPWPGEFSAFGLLASDFRVELARSVMGRLDAQDPGVFDDLFREMELEGVRQLRDQGIAAETITLTRSMSGMYLGQSWDTTCVLPRGPEGVQLDLTDAAERFEAAYQLLWGERLGMPIRVTSLRVAAVGAAAKPQLHRIRRGHGAEVAAIGSVDATLRTPAGLGRRSIGVYARDLLGAGDRITGPAVVVQDTSTTVLGAGDLLRVDEVGNLRITWEEPA